MEVATGLAPLAEQGDTFYLWACERLAIAYDLRQCLFSDLEGTDADEFAEISLQLDRAGDTLADAYDAWLEERCIEESRR